MENVPGRSARAPGRSLATIVRRSGVRLMPTLGGGVFSVASTASGAAPSYTTSPSSVTPGPMVKLRLQIAVGDLEGEKPAIRRVLQPVIRGEAVLAGREAAHAQMTVRAGIAAGQ